MTLTAEQKQWLTQKLGAKAKEKAVKKRSQEYSDFFDEKSKALDQVSTLQDSGFLDDRCNSYRRRIESVDADLHRSNGTDLKDALSTGKSELGKLKSEVKKDQVGVGAYQKALGNLQGHLQTIKASPVNRDGELVGLAQGRNGAKRTANVESVAAGTKELEQLEKEAAGLAKLAEQESAWKIKYENRLKDANTHLNILKKLFESDPTELEKTITFATKEVDNTSSYESGYKLLEPFQKVYDGARKQAESKQLFIADNSAKSELVMARLSEIDECLAAATRQPGLTSWIAETKQELGPIRELATNGQYVEAWKLLGRRTEWEPSKLDKSTKEKSEKATKKIRDDKKGLGPLYNNVTKELNLLAAYATEQVVDEFQLNLNRAVDIYLDDRKDKNEVERAKEQMLELYNTLGPEKTRLQQLSGECGKLSQEIARELSLLTDKAPLEVHASMQLEAQRLEAARSLKEFSKCQKPMETLLQTIKDTLKAQTEAEAKWLEDSRTANLDERLKLVRACSATTSHYNSLNSMWIDTQSLARSKNFAEANTQLAELRSLVETQQIAINKFGRQKVASDEADTKRMQPLFESAAQAILNLKEVVKKGFDNSREVTTPLAAEKELTALKQKWDASVKTAVEPGQLEEETIANAVSALIETILAAVNDPKQVEAKKIRAAQRGDEKRDKYEQQATTLTSELQKLANLESRVFVQLETKFATIEKHASSDYPAAAEAVANLIVEATTAIECANKNRAEILKTAQQYYDEAVVAVNEAEKKLKKKEDFAPYFENIRKEIQDIQNSLLASSNLGAVNEAYEEYLRLRNQANAIVRDAEAKGDATMTYNTVLAKFQEISNQVNKDKNLAACLPSRQMVLQEKLKEIQATIKKQSPSEATQSLDAFNAEEVQPTILEASHAQFKRDAFKANANTAKLKLKTLDKGLEYTASLASKLDGLREKVKTERGEDAAGRDLVALLVEIDRAANDSEFAEDENSKVIQARLETEAKKQQWKSRHEAFGTRVKDVNSAMRNAGSEADTSQLDALLGIEKEAKKLAKGGGYDAALKQLDLAEEFARKIIANPLGEKVTSRNNLPKDLNRYHDAVRTFNKSMEALVKVLASDDSQERRERATTMLEKLTFEFDLKAFDGAVASLTSKGGEAQDLKAKRSAKEDALGTVRAYQVAMDKNPLLIKLLMSPFKDVDIRGSLNGLRTALNSLDVNLRRCV